MTKLIEASAGRIVMRDTDGHVVFDTDEGLFQATERKVGSISLPALSASATSGFQDVKNTNVLHNLGSVHASSDTVVGAFKVTTSSTYGVGGLGWFNAGGSYIHYINGTNNGAFAAFTFLCSGGTLYLKERVALWAAQPPNDGVTNTHTMLALTFDYHLYVGSFV